MSSSKRSRNGKSKSPKHNIHLSNESSLQSPPRTNNLFPRGVAWSDSVAVTVVPKSVNPPPGFSGADAKPSPLSKPPYKDGTPSTTKDPPPPVPTPAALTQTKLETIPKMLVVELQQQDPVQVRWTLEDMSKLVSKGGQHKQEALRLGAPTLVVICMNKWFQEGDNHSLIHAKACDCLKSLACGMSETGIKTIVMTGAMNTILDAMDFSPKSLEVQRSAVGALKELLSVDAHCFKFLRELHGHETVVDAMLAFPEDITLQQIGCSLFNDISLEEEFHHTLGKSGAVAACISAARTHSDNAEITRIVVNMVRNFECASGSQHTKKTKREN